MKNYQKYEFCVSIRCPELKSDSTGMLCPLKDDACTATAKEFHTWIKARGFEIVNFGERCKCGSMKFPLNIGPVIYGCPECHGLRTTYL